MPLFFAIGVYGGFIQVSVGLFLLAGLVLGAGYNLIGANAMKNLIVLVFTAAALIVFVVNDQVQWTLGLLLGAGQAVGAWVAARFAVQARRGVRALGRHRHHRRLGGGAIRRRRLVTAALRIER